MVRRSDLTRLKRLCRQPPSAQEEARRPQSAGEANYSHKETPRPVTAEVKGPTRPAVVRMWERDICKVLVTFRRIRSGSTQVWQRVLWSREGLFLLRKLQDQASLL